MADTKAHLSKPIDQLKYCASIGVSVNETQRLSLITNKLARYELLDSGNFRKFERFGPRSYRPEPQAMWHL